MREWALSARRRMDLGRGLDPFAENLLLFDLKVEHFGAVFKLDLMEETRTLLQEEEARLSLRLKAFLSVKSFALSHYFYAS